jgi:hypothetical protein
VTAVFESEVHGPLGAVACRDICRDNQTRVHTMKPGHRR